MRKSILFLLILMPFLTKAQGIHFEQGLTWDQVLDKAKIEHKSIFVDCYATWCGPCKTMDKEIYPLKEVGDIYDKEFISVKLQMDTTAKDNEQARNRYILANFFNSTYTINAYPTFVFLDSEGRPLHKAVGSLGKTEFLQLANDAKNPEKQYYTLLKTYQPGKLNTRELLGLLNTFNYVDKELAGKMAADFLNRIPDSTLIRHKDMMAFFADNSQVRRKAIGFIQSLNTKAFIVEDNLTFIVKLKKYPEVQGIVFDYLKHLGKQDINQKEILFLVTNFYDSLSVHQWLVEYLKGLSNQEIQFNVAWFAQFKKDPAINKIALDYINTLPANEMFAENNINLLKWYTDSYSDRGFDFFYKQGNKVDEIMRQKDFAEAIVMDIVKKNEINSIITESEIKAVEPDFGSIKTTIAQRYNENVAERATFSAKGDFYKYMVYDKKQDTYWPKFLDWRIENGKKSGYDTIGKFATRAINNIVYTEFFFHCDNLQKLNIAATWQKNMVKVNPGNDGVLDTYACILYKVGQSQKALECERRALQIVTEHKDKESIKLYTKTISKMKKGEKIWLQKEYIDS